MSILVDMSKKTARALISGTVILSALILLLVVTVSEGAPYYKHVDEVMVAPDQWYGKQMSLHGFVVDRSIKDKPGHARLQVQAEDRGLRR